MTARDAERWVGRSLFDDAVPTPFLFVDRTILERNIAHMQALANAFSVGLRPHTKTHKIAAIAKMQLQAGACGLTVAKLGEAQALIDAGIRTSFMVAQPFVGAEKVRWALRLAEQNELLVCLDSLELAASLGEVAIALACCRDTGAGWRPPVQRRAAHRSRRFALRLSQGAFALHGGRPFRRCG